MTTITDDMYKEVPCTRCGQKRLAVASFCPHCGEIVKEGWFEKVTKIFRSEEGTSSPDSKTINLIPVFLAFIVAGYFLYTAIVQESLQGLIIAILSIYFAIRSMISGPPRSHQVNSGGEPSIHVEENTPDDPFADKFFCENCGTKVAADATECSKCGMKFG